MSKNWLAFSVGNVREKTLQGTLEAEGIKWRMASHVAATGTLAKALRSSGAPATTLPNLTDLIVWSGLEVDLRFEIDNFPSHNFLGSQGLDPYEAALASWQNMFAGRRAMLALTLDFRLRSYLTLKASNPSAAAVIRKSQREFRNSMQFLIASGFHPRHFSPQDPLGIVAVGAWKEMEEQVPAIKAIRDDIWIDPVEYERQSTPGSRALRTRIDQALDQVFGPANGERVIVYHGFYFFTAQQWAFFQLLRRHPNVTQVFVIHDDGQNPAFETWRRFFLERWEMPVPKVIPIAAEETPAAAALRDSLMGSNVDTKNLAGNVSVVEYRSLTHFVRDLAEQNASTLRDGKKAPKPFAPNASSIERVISRLGTSHDSESSDLAQLPVGQFLLALHDCINHSFGGSLKLSLSRDRVLDIAASGYLDSPSEDQSPSNNIPALRRAMPFFLGCETLPEWIDRATYLDTQIQTSVSRFGESTQSDSDLERIRQAIRNPLRLAPWCDLSLSESRIIKETINAICTLVTEIAEQEGKKINDHVAFIRSHLQRGMAGLPANDRAEIESKLHGFSSGGHHEVDAEGLVDIVRMLMGRQVEFDLSGEEIATSTYVVEIRGVDALGLTPSDRGIHLTNLAAGIFPKKASGISWPFSSSDLTIPINDPSNISAEIIDTRIETSALSDLYLFWLALDGVLPGLPVKLSWISEAGGQFLNLSPLAALITSPSHPSAAVTERTGGVNIVIPAKNSFTNQDRVRPEPTPSSIEDVDLVECISRLDYRAAASAIACPRRFAIQWALGPSAAYGSDHTHSMLFGNVVGAMSKWLDLSPFEARTLCEPLWSHLTPGERASSRSKRVVQTEEGGARWEWILTLGGNRNGSDPSSNSYQMASGKATFPVIDVMAPDSSTYLPPRLATDSDICLNCAVKARCAALTSQQR